MAVRISNTLTPGLKPQGKPVKKSEDPQGTASTQSSEKVNLSEKDGAVSTVREATKGVDEVDEAKVAELRAVIARGGYRPDLKRLAEAMIRDALQNDTL